MSCKIWEPPKDLLENAKLVHYMNWLHEREGLQLKDYPALWQWSVDHLEEFWHSIWDYFEIQASQPYTAILKNREMPLAEWFSGAKLNYAEHVFRHGKGDKPALLYKDETSSLQKMSWTELYEQTVAVAAYLKQLGVKQGDRVVGYVPNTPEAVIAFLACASIGAVWSCCAPDLGTSSVVSRFQQIEPVVLFAVDGYQFNGKRYDRREAVADIQHALPSLKNTILIPKLFKDVQAHQFKDSIIWSEIPKGVKELNYEQVPFNHPLWILYSSGTTGQPKGIVQGHGGIILEHLKVNYLHTNISPEDRFFWHSSTSWVVWNISVGALLTGATLVLYDGSPNYPDANALWDLASQTKATLFGVGAGYIHHCLKVGIDPRKYDLSHLKSIGSTGAPLTEAGFRWVYEHFPKETWLFNTCGGTDISSAFVLGSPILPIYSGEMQCFGLGVKVEAFDDDGNSLINQVGELVVTEPMPSMPIYFWNDPDLRKYTDAYFDMYPGVWRHGDWISVNERGGSIIYGRSDSTINKNGVRMGTSEIYQAVESIDEVVDSLVVDLEFLNRESFMPMFIVLRDKAILDEALKKKINEKIAQAASKRHTPSEIYQVKDIPKTLNGKKMEVPIRKLLLKGADEVAINKDTMNNPESLQYFIDFSMELNKEMKVSQSM